MKLKIQKKLAAKITKRSEKKVKLVPERMESIKEAITRTDVKGLINDGAILIKQDKGVSRARAKKIKTQKLKGRRKGQGSRKGRSTARDKPKKAWMAKVRLQRSFLAEQKAFSRLSPEDYKDLYRKSKGGFFRSLRHMKLYITEHKLIKNGNQ